MKTRNKEKHYDDYNKRLYQTYKFDDQIKNALNVGKLDD